MKPERSIVVPAYSEAGLIVQSLERIHAYLIDKKWLESTEIIVVTADAADGTPDLVAECIKMFPLHLHLRPGPRAGKGRDVRLGLQAARADKVLFMDADLATPLQHVAAVFQILEEKGGMVIGVRSIGTMHKTFLRKATSLLSNLLVRSMISWKIADSQCGFKAFDRKALEVLLPRSKVQGWGFDFEFIKIAKIHAVPISTRAIHDWSDPKPEGEGLAGDSQFSAMVLTMKELLAVKKRQLKGEYN